MTYTLKALGRTKLYKALVNALTQWGDIQQNGTLSINNDLMVIGATNASPIVITVEGGAHRIANGAQITIFGVPGNTAANGTYYAKTSGYGAASCALFSDAGMTTPVAGSGNYDGTNGGGGTVRSSGRQSIIGLADAATSKWLLLLDTDGSVSIYDAVNNRKVLSGLGAGVTIGLAGVTVTIGQDLTIGRNAQINGTLGVSGAVGMNLTAYGTNAAAVAALGAGKLYVVSGSSPLQVAQTF